MLEGINIDSTIPVYVQIENGVQFAIASEELSPGDKLPSVNELAARLGVNMNTIAKAYRDLEVMGLVTARRGMGVFINSGVQAKCRESCRKLIIGRLYEVVAEAKSAGMSSSQIREIAKKCISVEGSPYVEPPKEIMAMAKK